MTLRTVVLTLLLSASALALAPPAQAADPNVVAIDSCPDREINGGVFFDVRVDYDPATNTCNYWVGLIDAYRLCRGVAGLEHYQLREDVTFSGATGAPRTVHVVINYCAPILYCTCDPIEPAIDPRDLLEASTSSAAMQPPIYCVMAPCPGPYPPVAISWCRAEAATPAGVREAVWGTDEGCDIDADTTDYYACAPPSGFVIERTAGPVHVVLLVCDGGIPGALLDAIAEILRQLISTN